MVPPSQQYGRSNILQARARAFFARGQLPPGELQELDVLEKSQRAILLHQEAQHGPVFKVISYDHFWVCVIGLKLGRRFLRINNDFIQPVTIDLEPLVPGGFMRQMSGDTHRKYRRSLAQALARENLADHIPILEQLVSDALQRYRVDQSVFEDRGGAYIQALKSIVTGMLLRILFGAEPGSAYYSELMEGYADLGSKGMAWTLAEQQHKAFSRIRDCLRRRCNETRVQTQGVSCGLMHQILNEDGLDDTMLGNLIYMVEMGRDDTSVLFRWLSKYACEYPSFVERVFQEQDPKVSQVLCGAFVSETLRTDQSYRLLRMVTKNLTFENYFIPRNTMVRICMWESHRSENTFDQPFEFYPDRFLGKDYTFDEFAPFGIDQHQCPFAGVSRLMGGVFLKVLANSYRITAWRDGEAIRGPYHWEPAREFAVCLEDRSTEI